jgi:hypothetical protein
MSTEQKKEKALLAKTSLEIALWNLFMSLFMLVIGPRRLMSLFMLVIGPRRRQYKSQCRN